jgi:voltage-gated potassium channel
MLKTARFASNNLSLLFFIVLLISSSFLINHPLIRSIVTKVLFTLVLLAASNAIRNNRTRILYFAIGIIAIRQISNFLIQDKYMDSLATITSVIFFFVIVFQLIKHVARSKVVDREVILESINGYLLMGLSGSIIFALISRVQENAFVFAHATNQLLSDYLYFGFITQTTIGYGDITPVSNLAKLLTITMGISGQLYIAILIAMLVGKYLSQHAKTD